MIDVIKEFAKRETELNDILKDCESHLRHAPRGFVNIKFRNGKTYYYMRKDSKDKSGKYIKKNEIDKVKRVLQRDYERRVKTTVNKELAAIRSYKSKMPSETYEHTYDVFPSSRKVLITPHFVPDDEYVKNWLEEPYEKLGLYDGTGRFFTENGEAVRSKSEVLIANALKNAGIPYKYECPLFLGDNKVYPDFTILKMPSRKVVYWEHLGMLDDPDYANKNMGKLDAYEANGLFLGDDLIISRETSERPLSTKHLLGLIEHYLL